MCGASQPRWSSWEQGDKVQPPDESGGWAEFHGHGINLSPGPAALPVHAADLRERKGLWVRWRTPLDQPPKTTAGASIVPSPGWD